MNPLVVASRDSALSLVQVEEVFALFPDIPYQLIAIPAYGDKNKHISLTEGTAFDFFTREQDELVLGAEADIAVHSAKDLPYPLPAGLELYALLPAADKTDALVSAGNLTLAQLPAGSRVGTSSASRRSEILRLRTDLQTVGVRGTIAERIALVDNGIVDALIVASCALKRLGWERRIAETLPFATHPLQGNIAVTGRKDREELRELFYRHDIRRRYGRVTLAGFGPGNPDLLTFAADKALWNADIIFHDDLLDSGFLERYPAGKVYAGKRRGKHSHAQDDINEKMYRAAEAGKQVVRLKGGDPMIFAHGREEMDYLQSRCVTVDVIPGVSSGIALAAYTHIPLTHRGVASSVAFVSGHAGANAQTPNTDTLVYYMGGAHLSAISRKLIESGRRGDTPAVLAINTSLPDGQTVFSTLDELSRSVIACAAPVLLVAGDVASFERATPWETLYTGTVMPVGQYTGAIHAPLIRMEKINGNIALYGVVKKHVDYIIFTSRYGVRFFFETLAEQGIHVDADVRFASVGKVTSAEMEQYGVYPAIEPQEASAEGLIDSFAQAGITRQCILLPRSDKATPYLPEALRQAGNEVTDIPVYRNIINEATPKIDATRFRKIVFASPSCADAFVHIYGSLPQDVLLTARGKTTLKRLMELEVES
ncbi:MAG: uroporphyrinogen-III C-methyltransferase [Bacteroidales bacterium]|jgi:uroporphyrinogen III methyltransferase/synthase|nr:uroporphyrinogen-III C-methyltransferase [Bacteroidales bacterium]